MRRLAMMVAASALIVPPAFGQLTSPSDAEIEDTLWPKTFTVPGASQQTAQGLAQSLILERRAQDYCWEYGCLVIVNETANYNVTGFFVHMPTGANKRWGPNQFGEQLYPMRATYRFKTGDPPATCDLPVLFVLKHKKTKEVARIETRASLCKSPQVDSLVRIRMVKPEVTVE